MTVYTGTQKITMGRNKDTDYEAKLAAAKAQSGPCLLYTSPSPRDGLL